jgi:hypothetical protein
MSDKREVRQLTNYKWLNIKSSYDPELAKGPFYFAERLGKDSIAFIGYSKKNNTFLLHNEYLPPLDIFINRAFGGSIDKNKTLEEIVLDEIQEEAGYKIDKVTFAGKYFVSSMMNQFCYLYSFDMDSAEKIEKTTNDPIELLGKAVELSKEDVLNGNDWKAITIISVLKL